MTADTIENTELWKNSLGSTDKKAEKLRSEFYTFRDKAKIITDRISSTLPGLTVHDISHLDALWEVGSLITGKNYPMNPLEGFILGGAILLHDAAMSFEAFEGGLDEVRRSTAWKDALAEETFKSPSLPEDELNDKADFIALRQLHSQQAEVLASRSWKYPDKNEEIFLIEDANLRNHFSKLIGQVASSHHWDIESILKLPQQVNPPPAFPSNWTADIVKIACILRCADAAHIDSSRAPDFLYALIKRSGVSLQHWQAQNRLSRVSSDNSDISGESIVYTSTSKFHSDESESWWVIYDTVSMIEKEIKACNTLLSSKDITCEKFKIKQVRGANAPLELSKHVPTEGWSPRKTEIHVSNIERLITNLGGTKLYGEGRDELEVAYREILQNSRDAIQARKLFDSESDGEIFVELMKDDNCTWLVVKDSGIGMSERIFTGPFLDFGTSFWSSSLVKSEFPGLLSSNFKSIGQFGIGFYSIFMIADEVKVSTRPWNLGQDNVMTLHFKNGLSLRPVFNSGTKSLYSSKYTTSISIKLKPKIVDFISNPEIKNNMMGCSDIKVKLFDYFSSICAALDVPIYFSEYGSVKKIHSGEISQDNCENFLRKISFNYINNDAAVMAKASEAASRMRPVIFRDKQVGFAAINAKFSNNGRDFLSINTIGGLPDTIHNRDSEYFVGYFDKTADSAKRNAKDYVAPPEVIEQWAKDQVKLLDMKKLTDQDRYGLASSLCYFRVDPIEIAQILISTGPNKRRFMSFKELAALSANTPLGFFISTYTATNHIDLHHAIRDVPGYALILPLLNSNFLSFELINNEPKDDFSLASCLNRAIKELGMFPCWTKIEKAATGHFGAMNFFTVKAE